MHMLLQCRLHAPCPEHNSPMSLCFDLSGRMACCSLPSTLTQAVVEFGYASPQTRPPSWCFPSWQLAEAIEYPPSADPVISGLLSSSTFKVSTGTRQLLLFLAHCWLLSDGGLAVHSSMRGMSP